jgi:hypothetical protein
LPKRTSTEYIVHVCTLAGWADCVAGGVEAIVDVGALPAVGVLAVPDELDPVEGLVDVDPLEDVEPPEDVEPLDDGAGDTIATVEVDGDDVVAVVEDVEDDDGVVDAGLVFSFGTALANGLRAMRASTTLGDSFLVSTFSVVDVCAPAGAAEGGAGTVGVVFADALLSRNTGTATTATTSSATTIHSLRSTRSRRSELILVLRWLCRPERPAGR